jgi:hypothetical protein
MAGVSPALIALAIPILIMGSLTVWAVRGRVRHARARRSGPLRPRVEGVALGSAEHLDDAGALPAENVLEALAVRPEEHGPAPDGMPWDEGWQATILGLRSRVPAHTDLLEPRVFWGARARGQVLIRVGADEALEGSNTFMTTRHLRAITVLRVDAPPVELRGEDGVLRAAGEAPGRVVDLVGELSRAPDVWRELRVVAGPEGIVATRPSAEMVPGWIYDLWLLERLAARLQLEPLPPARVGPRWRVPYGLGRR